MPVGFDNPVPVQEETNFLVVNVQYDYRCSKYVYYNNSKYALAPLAKTLLEKAILAAQEQLNGVVQL